MRVNVLLRLGGLLVRKLRKIVDNKLEIIIAITLIVTIKIIWNWIGLCPKFSRVRVDRINSLRGSWVFRRSLWKNNHNNPLAWIETLIIQRKIQRRYSFDYNNNLYTTTNIQLINTLYNILY